MTRVLCIYGTETGNTLAASEIIKDVLEKNEIQVVLENVRNASLNDLQMTFDGYIIGMTTWGAVEQEVPSEFQQFYEKLATISLEGKRMAFFGSGDQTYPEFGKAVDCFAARSRKQGAQLVADNCKFHLHPRDSEKQIRLWAESVARGFASA